MNQWLEQGFAAQTLGELRQGVLSHDAALTLPQARRLTGRASELGTPVHGLRLGIVHTYTSDLLDPWLELAAALQGLALDVYHAPYGLNLNEAQPDSPLVRHRPDMTLLLLQREDLHPALLQPLSGLEPSEQQALRHAVLERVGGILRQFRKQPIGQLVVTVLPAVFPPGLGRYDAQSERSEASWWAGLKADLGALVRDTLDATLFLDLDLLLQQFGHRGFFDLRFWYSTRYPFTPQAAQALAQEIVGIGVALKYPKAKVIVLDADNTLWGGVIGEDGLHGIRLGPDYPGNLYVDFQRRLLHYQRRGLVLALCSKNNPADVEQVFDQHPHQLIKQDDLAALRVNWLDKTANLLSLAEELNLGLDSFIFVDDSAHECAAVRHQLPQVEVVQVPAKPLLVPFCLEKVARIEVLSLTDEDRAKTRLYAQERRRRELQETVVQTGGELHDYYSSLNMVMRIGFDDASLVSRLAQLTQKTNQFNLTTRRYDESQIRGFIEGDDWLVSHFSLADVFGDSGIVGLALWHRPEPHRVVMDTFLMSCRVIGRHAEQVFLREQLRVLARQDVREVVADYIPTYKNVLVREFLPEQGFAKGADGRFRRDLLADPPTIADIPIKVEVL